MKNIKNSLGTIILIIALAISISSCEKDARVKPDLSFKTEQGYIFKDTTVAQNTNLKFGIIAKKTEDELKTYNFSAGFDGGTTSSKNNKTLKGSEQDGFTFEESATTRSQAGTERYEFTVSDVDGNITTIGVNVKVQ